MRSAWLVVVLAACGGRPGGPVWAREDTPTPVSEIQLADGTRIDASSQAVFENWQVGIGADGARLVDDRCAHICRRIEGLVCSGADWIQPCELAMHAVGDGSDCAIVAADGVTMQVIACPAVVITGRSK